MEVGIRQNKKNILLALFYIAYKTIKLNIRSLKYIMRRKVKPLK
jgi:hypothetical protein